MMLRYQNYTELVPLERNFVFYTLGGDLVQQYMDEKREQGGLRGGPNIVPQGHRLQRC